MQTTSTPNWVGVVRAQLQLKALQAEEKAYAKRRPIDLHGLRNHPHDVFVYGTLKAGEDNYGRYLASGGAIYQRQAVTEGLFRVEGGSFPRLYRAGKKDPLAAHVRGEVYAVNEQTMSRLDVLESNGVFYQRIPIALIGWKRPAWAYVCLIDHEDGTKWKPRKDGTINWSSPPSVKTFQPKAEKVSVTVATK